MKRKSLETCWLPVRIGMLLVICLGLLVSPALAAPTADRTLSEWTLSEAGISAPAASDWQVTCVDCPHTFTYTTDRSLRLDSAGHPHIAYGKESLYYAWYDGAVWQIETVGDMGDAEAFIALALDGDDHPHLSYHYNPAGFEDYVRYATHDGSSWSFENMASTNLFPHNDIAADDGGYPHISYAKSDSFWYAYADDMGTHNRQVDEEMGYNGEYQGYNIIALDDDNMAHIAYYSDYAEGLKYAVRLPPPPPPPPAPACNRYVDLAGTCNGLTPCYTGIGLAVAAATPGDGICIFPGTYGESVDLSTMGTPGDRGLGTLNASGTPAPGTATINPAAGPAIYNSVDPFSENLYVDGLNLTSPDEDGLEIAVDQHIILQNLTANDNFDDGVDVYEVRGNVVMTDCVAHNNGDKGLSVWATGGNVNITGAETDGNYEGGISVLETTGHVNISDCSANNNTGGDDTDGIETEMTGGSVSLTNCTTNYNGDDGIDLDDTVGPVTVTGCTANGNVDESGIDVELANGDVLISDCTANDNGDDEDDDGEDGFYIIGASDVTFQDCYAKGNSDDGFDADWEYWGSPYRIPDDVTFINVTAYDNGDDGLELDTEAGVFLSRVSSVANGSDGIEFYSDFGQSVSNLTLVDSEIRDKDDEGLDFDGLHDTGVLTLTTSLICGNASDGFYLYPELPVNAEADWWGNPSGPQHPANPGGNGDEITGTVNLVDFEP
jgi:hypothetical protein